MPRIEMHIAKPCNQSWTSMKGDERVRFCGSCRKNVYNLTEMSEPEIEDLIRRTDGKFCGRLYRRTDNRVMQQDCPKGVAAVRRRAGIALAALVGAAYAVVGIVFRPTFAGEVAVRRPILVEEPVEVPAEHEIREADAEPSPMVMGSIAVEPDVRMGDIAVIPKREKP